MLKPKNIFGVYQLKKIIDGQGLAEVWEATVTRADTNEIVALKIFPKLDDADNLDIADSIFDQRNFDHHNLLPAKHGGVFNNQLYVEMQFCGNGTAKDKIGNLNEKELAKCLYQTASAIGFLHKQSMLHECLKPENILIDGNNYYCYLPDLGLGSVIRNKISTGIQSTNPNFFYSPKMQSKGAQSAWVSPACYHAPELLLENAAATPASDIWAMGAVIYEIASGKLAFGNAADYQQQFKNDLENLPNSYSPNLNKLIKKCLAINPAERPSAEEVERITANYFNTGSYKLSYKNETAASDQAANYPLIFLNDLPVAKSNLWKKLTIGIVSLAVAGAGIYYLIDDNPFAKPVEPLVIIPEPVQKKLPENNSAVVKNDSVVVEKTKVPIDTPTATITAKQLPLQQNEALVKVPVPNPTPKVIRKQIKPAITEQVSENSISVLPQKKQSNNKKVKAKAPIPTEELGIPTRRDSEQKPN